MQPQQSDDRSYHAQKCDNLFLKINLQEGIIDLSKTYIMWKDDLKIELPESLLLYDENQINLVGKMVLNFEN